MKSCVVAIVIFGIAAMDVSQGRPQQQQPEMPQVPFGGTAQGSGTFNLGGSSVSGQFDGSFGGNLGGLPKKSAGLVSSPKAHQHGANCFMRHPPQPQPQPPQTTPATTTTAATTAASG